MPQFEIVTFEGALPLRFGMSPREVANLIGRPRKSGSNWEGVLCYDYYDQSPNLNVGFGGEGQTANHFGFGRGSAVCFRGLDFFADQSAWRRLMDWSFDYHECLGFLVFCDLGIALTGFHDDYDDELAVTVFPRGTWDKFRPKFEPFRPLPAA